MRDKYIHVTAKIDNNNSNNKKKIVVVRCNYDMTKTFITELLYYLPFCLVIIAAD